MFTGEGRFKKLKEDDNAKRIEQIEAAQDSIKRLKIGPRSLDTAFMLADVLTTRQQQCQQNADMAQIQRENKFAEGLEAQAQAEHWREDHKVNLLQKKGRTDMYKKELREHIKSEDNRRQIETKKTIEMERQHRVSAERDLTAQLEKERAMLQRKKDFQRQNALEAMRMAEERRLRKFLDFFGDFFLCFYFRNQEISWWTKWKTKWSRYLRKETTFRKLQNVMQWKLPLKRNGYVKRLI